jgi:putative hydroxymethylpyrimidine transport system substrate-binding protein
MKKHIAATLIAMLSVVMATNSLAESQKLTLMLDWFVNPNHGPIIIAKQHAYFKEQGLDVTIQEPADPSTPSKLVAAGKVDMAISYQPNLIMDIAQGLPLIRSGTLIATPLNALITLKKNGIKTLSGLKGKTIGISIAGNEEATVGTMLKSAGLNFSDVKIVNVGWALSSSLASGKVDAIWGGFRNFEKNQLAIEGYPSEVFYPEENGVPNYDELVFVANAKNYNSKAIKAFNIAIEEAIIYILNHPEQAWDEFVTYAPDTLDNKLNKMAWQDTLPRFALRPSAIDLMRYDRYAQFLFDHGIIRNIPEAKNYIPVL